MKTSRLTTLVISALLLLAFSASCAREISHTESDKPGWFGGRTRQETTVIKNADGSISSEHSSSTVR